MAFKRAWALILGSNRGDEKDPQLDFHLSKWVGKKYCFKKKLNKISSLINSLEVANFIFITNP